MAYMVSEGSKKMEAEFNLGAKVPGKVTEWTSKGKELDPDRVRIVIYGEDYCSQTRKAVKAAKDSGINYSYRKTGKSQRNHDKWAKAARKIRCRARGGRLGIPVTIIDGKSYCGYKPLAAAFKRLH